MLYIVGGTVRDILSGNTPKDLDLAVEDARATAEMLCRITEAHYFFLDEERNMVRVYLGQERWQLDITSLGNQTIEDDLGRRDFTINAMAIPFGHPDISDADNILELMEMITGPGLHYYDQLIDPFQGHIDLRNKQIKKVSEGVFADDPVRLLRAVRLAGQLGYTLDAETEALIRQQTLLLEGSAGERIREEIMLILSLNNTNVWLEKLVEIGLMEKLLPTLNHAWQCKNQPDNRLSTLYEHSLTAVVRLEELESAAYAPFMTNAIQLKKDLMQQIVPGRNRLQILKLAGLMHDLGKTDCKCVMDEEGRDNHGSLGAEMAAEVSRKMALSKRETDTLTRLIRNHYRIFQLYKQNAAIGIDIFALMEELGFDYPLLVLLAWADWQSGKTDGIKKEQHFQEFLRFLIKEYYDNYLIVKSKPLVTGEDVMEVLKIEPSPKVGQVLGQVRRAQFMREITTREAAVSYLQSIII